MALTFNIDRAVKKFNKEMRAAAKEMTHVEFVKFHKKIAFQALRGITFLTPVDTGRARSNWQTTIGRPAEGKIGGPGGAHIPEQMAERKIAGQVINAGSKVIEQIDRPFLTLWITNNLDYILALEAGSSQQNSGESMVRKTLSRLKIQFGKG